MEAHQFSKNVVKIIQKIPRGKVMTYGQIAKLAGKPQGSRGVAWILHSSTVKHDLPWHRVINSQGKISFPEGTDHYFRQRSLLEREGVEFKESGKVDLKLYGVSVKTKLSIS